jgi:hypothetical protein
MKSDLVELSLLVDMLILVVRVAVGGHAGVCSEAVR